VALLSLSTLVESTHRRCVIYAARRRCDLERDVGLRNVQVVLDFTFDYRKLRYREEHSASVGLIVCVLYDISR